jgi:hypothetical protein
MFRALFASGIESRLMSSNCCLHRAHVLNIKGRSYRLRDLEEALKG